MWVIVTLASLVLLIVVILCVPLDVAVRLDVYGRPKFSLRLEWLFGLVSREKREGKKQAAEERQPVERKRKVKKRRVRVGLIFKIIRTKGLPRQLMVLLRGIFSRLKIRELGADFTVGLDNPADTEILFAFVRPTSLLLGPSLTHHVRLQPSFGEAVFQGCLHGAARLQPIQLVPPLLQFVFSLPVVRVMKTLVLTKWKRKK